jgi:hypothetical protein
MVLHRSTNNGHSRFSVEWRDLAVSRRLGDEIHPWSPNGDLRPVPAIRAWEANVCF